MLFTIGYEGSSICHFKKTLERSEIDLLIDVRELPLSRKPGFSKKALSHALEESGIEYLHFRSLGAPKIIRDSLKETGNWKIYSIAYNKLLENRYPELKEIASHSSAKRVCLMCFENDYSECHRSLITDSIEDLGYLSTEAYHLNPLTERVDPAVSAR